MSGLTRIEMDTMRAIENMNRKMKDQREIDWEQRRYEIARDMMAALISNPLALQSDVKKLQENGFIDNEKGIAIIGEINAREAVAFADALIDELKGGSK